MPLRCYSSALWSLMVSSLDWVARVIEMSLELQGVQPCVAGSARFLSISFPRFLLASVQLQPLYNNYFVYSMPV